MIIKYLPAALCLLSFSYLSHGAETPEKVALCQTCHGENGNAPLIPSYPKLAGQNEAYLVSALSAYKSGQRTGGLAGVMAAQAKMLSENEIKSLSSYYSQQQP